MIRRISLHLVAFVAFTPCLLIFSVNIYGFVGCIYAACLFIYTSKTERGKRFMRNYYHEVLRIENSL